MNTNLFSTVLFFSIVLTNGKRASFTYYDARRAEWQANRLFGGKWIYFENIEDSSTRVFNEDIER